MYSLRQLKRGMKTPSLFGRELNRQFYRRLKNRISGTDKLYIFEEDWDNLILLDACRYDTFCEIEDLPGELESRVSPASSTLEFLMANFHQRNLLDTVYVTSNPQLERYRNMINPNLHAEIQVWLDSGWDETFGTVLPKTMAEAAVDAEERYPNKRLVIHFMQPHYPFLTPDTEFDKGHLDNSKERARNFWNLIMEGKLEVEQATIREHYRENLSQALGPVKDLMKDLQGKTVVTSDHGNMIGERSFPIPIREWGHPREMYTKELVKVPWLVHQSGERKKILRGYESPEERSDKSNKAVQRLRDLGYAE